VFSQTGLKLRKNTMKESTPPTIPYWFVYVLECSDGHRDTGFTNDLDRAIFDHNSGFCNSTRDRGPINILSYFAFSDLNFALRFEKFLKKDGGKKLLQGQLPTKGLDKPSKKIRK
jgi:putative endonuclease